MEIDSPEEEDAVSPGLCRNDGPSVIYIVCVFAVLLALHFSSSSSLPSLRYEMIHLPNITTNANTVLHQRTSPPVATLDKGHSEELSSTASPTSGLDPTGKKQGMTASKFVVGISNGHQGTSFLGGSERYISGKLSRRRVHFFFERKSECVEHPCREELFDFCEEEVHPKLKLRSWYSSIKGDSKESKVQQEKLVENVCMPRWLRSNPLKVAILGHDTLFYLQGLLKYKNDTHFIRLRRARKETARSFTLSGLKVNPIQQFSPVNKSNCVLQVLKPGKRRGHLNFYALCPLERPEDVVLKPPSVEVWRNFSFYQRALWFIDEVEARWTLFLEKNKGVRYSEFSWSSVHPDKYGSMAQVHKSIATLLGLLPADDGHHVKVHVKTETSDSNLEGLYHDQDKEYQEKMRYSASTRRLISKVQF